MEVSNYRVYVLDGLSVLNSYTFLNPQFITKWI